MRALTGSVLSETFLSQWMTQLMPLMTNQTLLDISLPGTHDTMTYDLSTTVSDGGIDDLAPLAAILHDLGPSISNVGEWIRKQAQTQALTITQQLDNGIRFLDFRVMLTGGEWRALHCVQTNGLALDYLLEVKNWVDSHPGEMIVIWLSKHGNTCATGNDQFPGVSIADKQAFWKKIEALFGSLLVTGDNPVNTTPLKTLYAKGQRVVIYASDYKEFTNSAHTATDGCQIDNELMADSYNQTEAMAKEAAAFQSALAHIEQNKKANKFFLMSLAGGPKDNGMLDQAKLAFLNYPLIDVMATRRDCASSFNIEGLTDTYCPPTLIEMCQMNNYYKQLTINAAIDNGWGLPNAFYVDAVDVGGLLRTGTRPLSANETDITCDVFEYTHCATTQPACDAGYLPENTTSHFDTFDTNGFNHTTCALPWQNHYRCCRKVSTESNGFAYVDSLILYNVRAACRAAKSDQCDALDSAVQLRRSRNPVKRWEDSYVGRRQAWPELPWESQGAVLV